MTAPFEPERYELSEPTRYRFELPRRDFLKVLTAMGGGLLVVASLPEVGEAQQGESGRGGQAQASGDLASWIHIGADGRVTVYTGKVEIGQNIRTSLAQTVGDELRVPLASITMVMADTELTPFDQGTFGSMTTPRMAPVLARAAATAREMLLDEAASRWQVDRTTLSARDGRVTGGNRALTYGELMNGRALQGVVPANAGEKETPRDKWTLRSTPAKKVDARAFVTGKHAFTPDIVRPNMQIGRIVRPPAYGATPRSVDDAKARAMAGVTVVRDGNFIGVVAPSDRVAKQAAAAIVVQWDLPTGLPSSETVYEHFKQTAQASRGGAAGSARPPGRAFDASYRIPYIAHVPLEPRAAVAEWTGAKLTVWTGTQRPFGVRTEVAQAFRQPEDQVRVIVPDMGSGYGGKHTGEQAVEAARLARAAGKPVKLVYTRAEEFMWGYFRPGGVIDIAATVDSNGRIVAWEFENYNSGSSGLNTPYAVGVKRESFRQTDSPLRQGSYRGLAATANHYAREMHMDAIARALGVDAVEFRLKHLEEPRIRAVLTTAAEKAGWPRPSRDGRALGIACGTEKGSYVATVAEVSKAAPSANPDASPFKIERLVVVFECGAIVNPDGLKHQVEGAVVQGLGGALFEHIEFADGKLRNGTMADYRVPRFKDVPAIEVILLDRRDLPSAGAGETPIVCVAPAIGSAVRAFGTVPTRLPVTLT
jgi:nicotinate dehydrogenase subunit B